MCYTFPRIVSCEYYRFASGGGQDKISALCILGLNIVNDKVTEVQTQHREFAKAPPKQISSDIGNQ